jgi:uncharacterized protein (DUF1330 family)
MYEQYVQAARMQHGAKVLVADFEPNNLEGASGRTFQTNLN